MPVNIDHKKAEEIILKAHRGTCSKSDEITMGIKTVLCGTHKTYKYILVNGILAKASNNDANPIALQAGAPLSGAFDARSLCHKILVPFERDFLKNILGGSNEPFLNKPARFTHISKDNAVRKGKDKETLLLLIKMFSAIKTSEEAKEYLACVFAVLQEQIKEANKTFESVCNYSPELIEIYEFSLLFTSKSFEGETSAIIVGSLELLLHLYIEGSYTVKTHKVNQSGASSKEVGDIDIYSDGEFYYSIEVKDKNFNEYDVEHAFNKVLHNHGKKAAFIYGTKAEFNEEAIFKKTKEFEKNGLFVLIQDINSHIRNILFRLPDCTKQDFIKSLITTSESVNCKEQTKEWMVQLFSELQWESK
ncbi:restriction endonuclease, SacI family [Candidatus Marithrix sp. Canyon 246]|uniref:restriction endonuclease, SacI family n=1 Tax=Candidatus Marithrix sp. Canyon 246 TaxID=1827136 RepID=UPI00084A0F60|nr:restriction endonuclease, SacI family [Candidatus Marithrix sp. Canyon 246]